MLTVDVFLHIHREDAIISLYYIVSIFISIIFFNKLLIIYF